MTIRHGEIYWVETKAGLRPAAVLTRDSAIPLLHRVVVAPATRTIRNVPSEVRLTPADGMPDECVLSLDNIYLAPKRTLKRRITSLNPQRLDEVCEAIRFTLGCV